VYVTTMMYQCNSTVYIHIKDNELEGYMVRKKFASIHPDTGIKRADSNKIKTFDSKLVNT
jgi:hypothetical protein